MHNACAKNVLKILEILGMLAQVRIFVKTRGGFRMFFKADVYCSAVVALDLVNNATCVPFLLLIFQCGVDGLMRHLYVDLALL